MWKTTLILALVALVTCVSSCSAPQKKPEDVTSSAPAATAAYPSIVLYSLSRCPHCMQAKDYFAQKNIPYTNRDVEQDKEAEDILLNRYESDTVPLIVIGNDEAVLRGFSPELFEQALGTLKKP